MDTSLLRVGYVPPEMRESTWASRLELATALMGRTPDEIGERYFPGGGGGYTAHWHPTETATGLVLDESRAQVTYGPIRA